MNELKRPTPAKPERLKWKRPEVRSVGTVAEVLRGGGGKQSVTEADVGDNNKVKGQM